MHVKRRIISADRVALVAALRLVAAVGIAAGGGRATVAPAG